VWYDDTAIANIFGLSDLKKKHRITFDSEKEDAFIVHMDKGNMESKCNPKGLYTFEVSDKYLKKENHLKTLSKYQRNSSRIIVRLSLVSTLCMSMSADL
jgi:hypothetical protein